MRPQMGQTRGWQIPLGDGFAYGPSSSGEGAGTFQCDLPNGDYRVVFFFCDPEAKRSKIPFDVYANGEKNGCPGSSGPLALRSKPSP